MTNKHGGGYRKWLAAAPTPTVFNRLEDAGISWRIYFDKLQLVSFTGVLHAPVLQQFWKTERFATMEQFHHDVKHGTLPLQLPRRPMLPGRARSPSNSIDWAIGFRRFSYRRTPSGEACFRTKCITRRSQRH